MLVVSGYILDSSEARTGSEDMEAADLPIWVECWLFLVIFWTHQRLGLVRRIWRLLTCLRATGITSSRISRLRLTSSVVSSSRITSNRRTWVWRGKISVLRLRLRLCRIGLTSRLDWISSGLYGHCCCWRLTVDDSSGDIPPLCEAAAWKTATTDDGDNDDEDNQTDDGGNNFHNIFNIIVINIIEQVLYIIIIIIVAPLLLV